ncbi:MAG: CDF family Co(II)/Ni(II) efflux transporter DmeF [Pseudomonadota bacterium]
MQPDDLAQWRHDHLFDDGNAAGERGTWLVMWITAITMVAEIAAGWFYNSMALLADGFHMSSHAVAIGLSAFAYAAARKYANDSRFAFGTWKIEILGGFASAIFLLAVVGLMLFGSVERLFSPQPIHHYKEAILIAALGLLVNIVSALILGNAHHDHSHGDGSELGHGHGHANEHPTSSEEDHRHQSHRKQAAAPQPDLNLKSAYVHVLADAATSVLAIVALLGGWLFGWAWLDPVMGIVGAVVVALWAKRLIIETSKVLLDREMDHPVVDEIRTNIEDAGRASSTHLTDLHVWRVGRGTYSCAISVVTQDASVTPTLVRQWISMHEEVVHSTIEVEFSSGRSFGPSQT